DPPPPPIYDRWRQVPLNLVTKTQLKERGLILAPNQKPVALIAYHKNCYQLYDTTQAIPKPPQKPRQTAQKKAAV
ncbi:MAG: hypothetical protein OT477_22510, partial [Chloroflexi bacterium]|nr:hypothetical protein [Chloroflexota bacterium]